MSSIPSITNFLLNANIDEQGAVLTAVFIAVCICAVCWLIAQAIGVPFAKIFQKFADKSQIVFDDYLVTCNVPAHMVNLVSAVSIFWIFPALFEGAERIEHWTDVVAQLYLAGTLVALLCALLEASVKYITENRNDVFAYKSLIAAGKYLIIAAGVLWMIAVVAEKPPIYFLSGLGAVMAVLTLAFKDLLVGVSAGVIIAKNGLAHKGDWLELPTEGADGTVEDITLTTIKIRNWNNTISNIPTYALVSKSFHNWEAMSKNSAGRRIKRVIKFDYQSVHFLTLDEAKKIRERFPKITFPENEIITPSYCFPVPATDYVQATNLTWFRAYCRAFLENHPMIRSRRNETEVELEYRNTNHQLLVRQLDGDQYGLPVEIYAFTRTTDWGEYEKIQAEILEHFIAVAPIFNLNIYQRPKC